MTLKKLKNKKLPDNPGVYFFKKGPRILYIGKATSLRDRVKSYFSSDLIKTRGPAILDMVTISDDITFKQTDSVLEALLLESELIKFHKPKYNVKEKDNKSYLNVVVTDEEFPRILTIRNKDIKDKKSEYKIKEIFGPFPNSRQLKKALRLIQKIFPFFDTLKPVEKLNEQDKKRFKLNIQIGIYPDVFSGHFNRKDYKKTIDNIILFFKGKKTKILIDLEKDMYKYAKNQNFEQANNIKKTIFALKHINDISMINDDENIFESSYYKGGDSIFRIESYDIAHTSGYETVGAMVVMENNNFKKNDYRKFIIKYSSKNDDYGALSEVIHRRFNHLDWTIPNLIVIDGGIGQKNVAEKILKEFKVKIPIVSVVKDNRHKPKDILGNQKIISKYRKQILEINQETHRFAINFHRKRRNVLK